MRPGYAEWEWDLSGSGGFWRLRLQAARFALSPPAMKGAASGLAVGREVLMDCGDDLIKGQGGDAGKDERLKVGVAFDLARTARAMGAAVFGLQCLTGLPGVQGRLNRVFNIGFNGL